MKTTYFVSVGASSTALLGDIGGMEQLAKIDGDLGFIPIAGALLTFPKSQKPGIIFKIRSYTGGGFEQVSIVRVVRTSQTGPNVQTVN